MELFNRMLRRMDAIVMVSDIRNASMKIIMFTIADNDEGGLDAISAGADSFVLRSSELEYLWSAILCCDADQISFPLFITQSIARGEITPNALEVLSPRQMDVVEFVKQGLGNKTIAYKLKLSENTVRNHLRNIMEKLGLKNRVQLATLALQEEWRWQSLNTPPQNKPPLAPYL